MKTTQKKNKSIKNILRLFYFLWQESRFFACLLLFVTIILGVIPAAELWLIGFMVDDLTVFFSDKQHESVSLLLPLFILLVVLMLMRNWLRLLSEGIQDYLREKVGGELQKQVIEKASEVDLEFYDQAESYDQLQRANEGLKNSFVNVYMDSIYIVQATVTILAFLLTLTVGHWSLGPIVAIGALFSVWLKMKRAKEKYEFSFHVLTPIAKSLQYFSRILTTKGFAKELRIFGSRDYIMHKWQDKQRLHAEKVLVDEKKEFHNKAINAAFLNVLILGVSLLIAYSVVQGSVSIGYYVILLQVIIRMQDEMESLTGTIRFMYEQALFTDNLFSFLDRENTTTSTATKKLAAPLTGAIQFEDVWFKYPGSADWVIKGLSFQVHPKETVSIVGENGAGKSTIIKLLLGLYKPQKGTIYVDQIPLEEIDAQELRRNMSAVFQDFTKFELTLRESIGIGKVESIHDLEPIEAVAEQSQVNEWLDRLDHGYQTYLSKAFGGTDLSGGQWQKVALARSLMRESEIFILDEPTSALDPLAELEVFKRFSTLSENRTVLLISHRMGTARLADRIIVIENGMKIEEGNHEALMKKKGIYAQLFSTQAKWYPTKSLGEEKWLKQQFKS